MNNISWSKTIGNWAKNDQNFDPNAPVAESKELQVKNCTIQ